MRKCRCLICGRDIVPVNFEDPSVCVHCLRCLASDCKSLDITPDYADDGTPTVTCAACKETWSVADYERELAARYNLIPCTHCAGSGYMAVPGAARPPLFSDPQPEKLEVMNPVLADIQPEIDMDAEDGDVTPATVGVEDPAIKC